MLQSQVLAHFQVQSDLLLAGALEGFGAMFTLPLPIHYPGGLTVVRPEAGADFLMRMRNELVHRGIVGMRPVIAAMELPRAGRFRVWIDWQEITASGAAIPGSRIVYFCRNSVDGLRTEMMQYTHLSSPGLVAAPEKLPLSA